MKLVSVSRDVDDCSVFSIKLLSSSDDVNEDLLGGQNLQIPYLFGGSPSSGLESIIDPHTFCHAFPFHSIFDRHLTISQLGSTNRKLVSGLVPGLSKFNMIFDVVRPDIGLTFDGILSRLNAVFVAKTNDWLNQYRSMSAKQSWHSARFSRRSNSVAQIDGSGSIWDDTN